MRFDLPSRFQVPTPVWRLGWVSLLTDLSSEMIFAVFAMAFTLVAGGSTPLLGIVEGLADFSSCALDGVSGRLADRRSWHKRLAVAGYGFSAIAKIVPFLSLSLSALGTFRVVERLGKSVRGAPRDAWLASTAPAGQRGYVFGVHKALDKTGAVVGPLVAYGILAARGESSATIRCIFALAVVPAFLAVWVLVRGANPRIPPVRSERVTPDVRRMSPGFRRYLVTSGVFSLGYFSFAFLLLRAHVGGFGSRQIVLLYALYNAVFVIAAPVIGRVSDRFGRAFVLMTGYGLGVLVNVGLSTMTSRGGLVGMFVLHAVLYSIDEAQSKAFVADLEPSRTGRAIGGLSFLTGLIYLPASLLAGYLWSFDMRWPFLLAAALSACALLTFALVRPDRCLRPYTGS